MIRWLDFNDTWLAAEWGHPSDNLGGILATADWLARHGQPLTVKDVLTAMIKAHEIQGVIALENSFNRVGLDHVVLVKVASTAVVANMLGCTYDQVVNAVSQAWVDGQSLRTYRHAPNTGSRKSWAAGDATSRAVRLALISQDRRDGLSLGAHREDLGLLRRAVQGQGVQVPAPLRQLRDGERAVQDLLPGRVPLADRGGMRDAAAPAGEGPHPRTSRRSPSARTRRRSASSTRRGRSTTRPTATTASSTWSPCRSSSAASPRPTTRTAWRRIRASTPCAPRSSASRTSASRSDYHDPKKRSIANALTVEFKDGTKLKEVVCEYPIGHKRRRKEGMPVLVEKFKTNLARRFPEAATQGDPRAVPGRAAPRCDAGQRVRRPDGRLRSGRFLRACVSLPSLSPPCSRAARPITRSL